MRGRDDPGFADLGPTHRRPRFVAAPRPGVAEPERRQEVDGGGLRAAVRHGDADRGIGRVRLGVFHLDVEVAVIVEDARVEELVLGIRPTSTRIGRDEVVVGKGSLRVLVREAEVRVGRRGVLVEVVLLDVLAVVALSVRQPEQALLENRVAAVPESEREAQDLSVVRVPGDPVLARAVRARARLVVAEVRPRIAVVGVVLADRPPLPLGQVGTPKPPRRIAIAGFREALPFGIRFACRSARCHAVFHLVGQRHLPSILVDRIRAAFIRFGVLVVLEVGPSRDIDTVVLGRCECPPMGRMRTVRQASASCEGCRDSCFGLIGRHADVDVGPATPGLGRWRLWNDTYGLRRCRSTTSSFGPRLRYPRAAAQNGPTSLSASCATAMPTTWTWEGSGSIRNFRASAEIWRASSTSRWLRAPYSPEAVRTVTPSGRTSTSGKWPTASATSAIAATNLAASANDPTRK